MSQFNLSLFVSLALIIPSGSTAIYLVTQPNLTAAQIQVLETSLQICSGSSTVLLSVLAAKRTLPDQKQSDDQ
ncbi:hypothetical protein [Pantanalinema sp. GBBB05]|uniref:hypothetical protein n=1 Tax=Pantanalinema sp. GBBB05 TaxID=2604139 RepID=UPI001D6DF056|nr:hypothetical protein [Pantanalinema sp. GBBB05]